MVQAQSTQRSPQVSQPMVWLAAAWAIGLWVGAEAGPAAVWPGLVIAPLALGAGAWMVHRSGSLRLSIGLIAVGVGCVAIAWWSLRGPEAARPDLARYVGDESRLARVEGRIVSEPRLHEQATDGLAGYMYSPPTTMFFVAADTLVTDDARIETVGGLLVSISELDTRVRLGDRVRVTGWLTPICGPANPGEGDFAEAMDRMGVVGKLFAKRRGNVKIIEQGTGSTAHWRHWHATLRRQVADELAAGMAGQARPQTQALLDAMLLGLRSDELDDLSLAFRQTGLAHLLAISGLHVGMLAMGMWWLVQILTGRPRWAAVAALVAVGLYMVVVPWRVPIVRAGFMTLCVCLGLMWYRRLAGLTLVSLIGLAILIWRPAQLFDPGFELSFGIVVVLLVFTARLAERLGPDPNAIEPGLKYRVRRRISDYLAVSLVAWLTALPIVVYHFNMISPLAVLLSVLVFPLVAALLWVGFAKIALGLIVGAAGELLAWPLAKLGDLLIGGVTFVADVPGAWLKVPQPSAAWAICVLGVVIALLAGWFAKRRTALAAVLVICAAWLYAPSIAAHLTPADQRPALIVHMLAVGNGSCFVIQSDDRAMLFDCGSSNYAQVGRKSIVPALHALGIRQLDMIVISHADYDHFSGTLDVVDQIPTGRIVTTAAVIDEATDHPNRATGYLIRQLKDRKAHIETIAAGWAMTWGRAQVEAIWPPRGLAFELSNDGSIVLSFRAAGRRLLMCGDIQEQAMAMMLAGKMDITADVTDLPHHGSFPPPALAWVGRVGPRVVLQSSSRQRLNWDKWAGHLAGIERYISAIDGAVVVRFMPSGRIETQSVRP